MIFIVFYAPSYVGATSSRANDTIMLTQLHIKNFAIIEQLDLDILTGMTSMTGETGAGKSILLDALGLVLGDRAEAGNVRHGCAKADISASFDLGALPELNSQLDGLDLDSEQECIIRRVVTSEGRSKGYLNGSPVTLQILRDIGKQLVDIHGQHEHQSLLKKDIQRQRLDDYGNHKELLCECLSAHRACKLAQQQYEQLRSAEQQRNERLDLLNFQARELEQLNLQAGEWHSINEEHNRLANAEKLLTTAQTALQILSELDEQSLSHQLGQQLHAIEQLSQLDSSLKNITESLNTALIHTEEAGSALRSYADSLDMDPTRLQYLETRMGDIHSLSRKHQMEPEALLTLQQNILEELQQLENADATLAELLAKLDSTQAAYQTSAEQLHQLRTNTAQGLSALVSEAMQGLGMDGGRFQIEVLHDDSSFNSHGQDKIEFMVSTNPGQPLKALSKVASGGELSRISLAIQMITASCEKVPTLIFDEVDTGIGGGVAEVVGKHLRSLGVERQVMCVTHLPQVAAQAHQHLKVAKQKGQDITTTSIKVLNDKDRIDEVARMLGGIEMTEQTIKHAEEMIQRATI